MASSAETTTLSLERFAPEAKAIVVAAQALADDRRHVALEPIHVLSAALAKQRAVSEVFARASVDPAELIAALERALSNLPRSNQPAYLSAAALDLLARAEREADREQHAQVLLEDLLNALCQELRGPLGQVLSAFRLGPGVLRPHLSLLRSQARPASAATAAAPENGALRSLIAEARALPEMPVVGRARELRRLLSVLERKTKCHPLLVGEAGVGKRAIISELGRRLAEGDVPTSLSGAELLELDPAALGSGSRLRGEIEERARQLVSTLNGASEPRILVIRALDQLFVSNAPLSGLPDLLAAALERGELRLLGTTTPDGLRKIDDRNGRFLRLLTVLEVEEPSEEQAVEMLRAFATRLATHHQVHIGESAVGAAVALARRYLQDRKLPESAIDLLDETASRKRVAIDGLPESADAEVRRFESVETQLSAQRQLTDTEATDVRTRLEEELKELSPRVASIRESTAARRGSVAAVRTLRAELEKAREESRAAQSAKNQARVEELERGTIVELTARLARAEESARTPGAAEQADRVGAEDVAATLASWTGIPVNRLLEGEAERLLGLEQRLSERVVGQDHAVHALARAVRRGRVGLRDPRKPIGSFLFLGPSGVGKTELAKALAGLLFDDERALTRLDMSEFMERHMAQRLIGAPPGYADSEQGGFLTEAVRRRPYSVLLFDEVEKAHRDVFNLLLQLLDDGRLTDGRGKTADFSNTVIILTSNIGSERILETEPRLFESEEGRTALRELLLDRLKEFFRPELLNRIDEVLVFRALTKEHLRRVVELELRKVQHLLLARKLSLTVSDAAKDRLVDLGYEPALGARPLRRTILRQVQDPLAEALLSARFADATAIRVELEGDRFVLNGDTPQAPASDSTQTASSEGALTKA